MGAPRRILPVSRPQPSGLQTIAPTPSAAPLRPSGSAATAPAATVPPGLALTPPGPLTSTAIAEPALRFRRDAVAPLAARRLPLLVALPIEPRELLLRPRLVELRLQLVERPRAYRAALAAQHDESHGPIE